MLGWYVLMPLRLQSLPYPTRAVAPILPSEATSPFPADLMHIAVTSRYKWPQIAFGHLSIGNLALPAILATSLVMFSCLCVCNPLPYPTRAVAPIPPSEATFPFPAYLMHIAVTSRYTWPQITFGQSSHGKLALPRIGHVGITCHKYLLFPFRKNMVKPH